MNKIGLLIPTRERLNLQLTLISSIITTVDDINNVNLYFGVDLDDPTFPIIQKICQAIPFVHLVPIENNGQFIGINNIWNILAKSTTEEVMAYLGDDMTFHTSGWDTKILEEFNEQNLPKDAIKLVHCWDGFQGDKLTVNAFVHRKYYEVMGYFCKGDFLINYSDSWMHSHFRTFNRVVYRPDIFIRHNHWILGGHKKDKTADRMLSDNHDKISDQLWEQLNPERRKDVLKLAKYLKIEPDWSKF